MCKWMMQRNPENFMELNTENEEAWLVVGRTWIELYPSRPPLSEFAASLSRKDSSFFQKTEPVFFDKLHNWN